MRWKRCSSPEKDNAGDYQGPQPDLGMGSVVCSVPIVEYQTHSFCVFDWMRLAGCVCSARVLILPDTTHTDAVQGASSQRELRLMQADLSTVSRFSNFVLPADHTELSPATSNNFSVVGFMYHMQDLDRNQEVNLTSCANASLGSCCT